ncbi:MAG: tetratricopeptide repeat protein [Trueperaceae bacterium]
MLRTFGGLELIGSNLTRKRPLLLLAYLVGLGGRAERSALAGAFYSPDVDQSDNLTTDLARLRKSSTPECVLIDGRHIRANVRSDLAEFRQLLRSNRVAEAEELYLGPFLNGFSLPTRKGRDSAVNSAVETWILSVRRETAEAVLDSLVMLIRQATEQRNLAEAARLAEQASEVVWDAEANPEVVGLIQLALTAGNSANAQAFAAQARSYGVELQRRPAHAPAPANSTETSAVPARLSSFVGRTAELLAVGQRLRERAERIIAITGPGGNGKSRLALELARAAEQEALYTHGVTYVNLEGVKFSGLVPIQVAKALGLELKVGGDAWRQVAHRLKDRSVLLVLDNVDDVLEAGPELAQTVRQCPGLHVLLTSRAPTGVEGESSIYLGGLAVHDDSEDMSLDHDALRLFEERARSVDATFRLTSANRDQVASICRLVGGSPLAIEWLAEGLPGLSLDAVLERLTGSDHAVDGGAARFAERHRSPAAVFAASWERLEPAHAEALAALALFEAGFTLMAASAVADADTAAMQALTNSALIRRAQDGRYDFEPLVRRQALLKLRGQPRLHAAATGRYQAHYLQLIRSVGRADGAHPAPEAAAVLKAEHANLRRAWRSETDAAALYDYAALLAPHLERNGQWNELLELCNRALSLDTDREEAAAVHYNLATVHQNRGELALARTHLATVLERSSHQHLRAEALNALGGISYQLRELKAAREQFEQARQVFLELGADAQLAASLNNIAAVEYQLGDFAEAVSFWEDALRLQQLTGNTLQQARTHNNLGMARRAQGELDEAAVQFDKALLLRQRAHDAVGGMVTQANKAGVLYEQGDFAAATDVYQKLLARFEDMGDRANLALTLNDLAAIDEQLGRLSVARRRLLEAELIQEEIQDLTNLALTLNNLALVELSSRDERRATVYAKRAYALADATGNLAASVYSLTYLAGAKLLGGDPDAASALLDQALSLASELNLRSAKIHTLTWAARVQHAAGGLELAEGYAREAAALARQLGQLPYERAAVVVLTELLEEREEWEAAREQAARLLDLDIRLKHPKLDHDRRWRLRLTDPAADHKPTAGTTVRGQGKEES